MTDRHADTIDDQLRLLGQLVGTRDPQGLQDMRDIVARERGRVAAVISAARTLLDACGGDVPDWLMFEASALDEALGAATGGAETPAT